MAPRARLVVAGAALWLAAGAVPATAATDHEVDIGGYAFGPTPVTLAEGDSVTWHWVGPDTNHSVASDAGQAMEFHSDDPMTNPAHVHNVGDTFTVVFPTSGCFQYHCQVHAYMHGEVQVGTGVCPPPAPPAGGGGGGGGGGGNGPPPPPPPASPVVDTTPPAFGALRVRSRKLVFRLSEAAKITIRIRRGHRTLKTFHIRGKKGANSFRLTHRGLKKGRYRALIAAVDGAGNRSRTVKLPFRL